MSTPVSQPDAGVAPKEVTRLTEVMASYSRPWALCGGWALDAWLGRITRSHGDVDLSVFDADHEHLFQHMDGWQLIAHHEGADDSSALDWAKAGHATRDRTRIAGNFGKVLMAHLLRDGRVSSPSLYFYRSPEPEVNPRIALPDNPHWLPVAQPG